MFYYYFFPPLTIIAQLILIFASLCIEVHQRRCHRMKILMGYMPICSWSRAASNRSPRAFVLTSNNGENQACAADYLSHLQLHLHNKFEFQSFCLLFPPYVIVCWPLLIIMQKWGPQAAFRLAPSPSSFPPTPPHFVFWSVKNEMILYANS